MQSEAGFFAGEWSKEELQIQKKKLTEASKNIHNANKWYIFLLLLAACIIDSVGSGIIEHGVRHNITKNWRSVCN